MPRAIRSGKILPAGLSLLAAIGIWRFRGLVWSSSSRACSLWSVVSEGL